MLRKSVRGHDSWCWSKGAPVASGEENDWLPSMADVFDSFCFGWNLAISSVFINQRLGIGVFFCFRVPKIKYHEHQRISRTFLLNIFVSNWGCGLSARTSVHHAVHLHKLTLLKELLTDLTLPFLSRQMSLSRESPFRFKVVYSLDDGCLLQQKSIHRERENTMLFSSILIVNGRLFLRCSIVWRQLNSEIACTCKTSF